MLCERVSPRKVTPTIVLQLPPSRSRAVTLPAKMKWQAACQPATAPPQRQNESARGVVRRAVRERRDEKSLSVAPGHRTEPPSPAEQATTADAAKIGSLSLKCKSHERAQVKTCFVGTARVAPSRPVREAPYRSTRKDRFARSDRAHCVT